MTPGQEAMQARQRWWGWGEDAHATRLPEPAAALLGDELDLSGSPSARVGLEQVHLPAAELPGAALDRLRAVVGGAHVRDDRLTRVSHAAGRSYPDLVRLRSGDIAAAPDAVVYPGSAEEVAGVLAACTDLGVAVIPFGGGTSVVGGVSPGRGVLTAAVSLDLARMSGLAEVDRRSLTAAFAPGTSGPQAEAALAGHGLTLGHYPQSFEYATVGGFVATRSAGQASTGYGRIDELVLGLRLAAPAGELSTRVVPASAAGPPLRELVVGSEGVFGVITQATLAVRAAPRSHRYEGWSFTSFEHGIEAFRQMEQSGASPDVARLSDEQETRVSLALAASGGMKERLGRAYLRARGQAGGCVAILGWEGEVEGVARRRSLTAAILRDQGGVYLGQGPGRAWLRGRFAAPYLRDDLLDRGVMVETLETAAVWSDLPALHRGVGDALSTALAARGTPPLVACHISHLYRSGASLYFTFMARQDAGAPLEQWRDAKRAAGDAIMAAGATITHHHAVGSDHAPWMSAEVGPLGIEVLRAAKERLDPLGIMNPGKLLPGD